MKYLNRGGHDFELDHDEEPYGAGIDDRKKRSGIELDVDRELRKSCVLHVKIKKKHRLIFRLKLLVCGIRILSRITGFRMEVDYVTDETSP